PTRRTSTRPAYGWSRTWCSPAASSRWTPCSPTATSARPSATAAAITWPSSRTTNRRCCTTSRWPLPPRRRRLFPPAQQRLWRETFDEATTHDKGHGRRERRTLQATTALTGYLDWPDLAQVGRVEAEVTRGGKTTREVRYFITSVPRGLADARQLLAWV